MNLSGHSTSIRVYGQTRAPSKGTRAFEECWMNTAKPGALGGASNEAGAGHRAGIAALAAVYGLLEEQIPWLRSDAVPVKLRMEADLHVDDVVVDLADGTTAFMQAKLSPNAAAFNATVDQWCRAVVSGECRPGDELLFVVTRTDEALARTAQALTTYQSGASLTSPAARRLDALRGLAAGHGLDHADTERLLAAAKVIALDARDNGPDEALGSACLNAAIVPTGHGRTAFRTMKAAARGQAEQRTASDVSGWYTWLTSARIPLIADASGTPAARLQAMDQALAEHRMRWAAQQDTLPLADLGRGLTSMTVPGTTRQLRALAPARKTGRSALVDAVRRQGRLFLVGSPGSGKTVASRLLAAYWAGHHLAPVPVWLRMKDLVPFLTPAGPYRLQAADLVRAAIGTTNPPLIEALSARVNTGDALILLDALDEVHERQDAVVEAVATLLDQLPAGLDIVVTSRHSSQSVAARLDLPVYELRPPNDLTHTLDHLLDTAVAARAATRSHGQEPVEDLRRRVEHSRRAESDLWNVPLMATLMVLLIVDRPAAALLGNRARLLTDVIDSSVREWEMRRPSAQTLPDTDPQLTADILIDCFDDIAHTTNTVAPATWHDAHQAVSARLQQHWGKPPGTAAAIARRTLEYWDATAGVFVTDTPQGNLIARTRLFAEIGEARWAMRNPSRITAWMQSTLADPERQETARLAASLSPQAAEAFIQQALLDGGDSLDLVHDALADGTVFDSTALHAYHDAQLTRLPTIADRNLPSPDAVIDLDTGSSPRAELAARLAEEDLDAAHTRQLIDTADTLGPEQKAVITALCTQRQIIRRGTEPTPRELDTLEAGLAAAARGTPGSGPEITGADPLARFAVEHVLPTRPGVLPHLVATAHHVTLDTFEWLESELPKRGHHGALGSIISQMTGNLFATLIDSYKKTAVPFEFLADLNSTTAPLTTTQVWHLDEAAALTTGLRTRDHPVGTVAHAVTHHAELTRNLLRLITEAGGLDGALVSAQLRSLREETPQRPDWGLLSLPSTRTPHPRLRLDTIDTDLVIKTLTAGNSWLTHLTLLLAAEATTSPDFADRVLTALPDVAPFGRLNTAALLAHRWPALRLPMEDPLVRAGAARITAAALSDARQHRDARYLLADPDLLVRHAAARELYDPSPGDRTVLATALASPALQWTCGTCGATTPVDGESCPQSHPQPEPSFPDGRSARVETEPTQV
ncbi:hypothetical protein ABT144_29085 [Streptomyces sp. NPDC002039]|uniref:NACHT domain-containing protein n=1 Tax=Streptomyces sp. NPDC002039 TaxID=3154660 RepID=UPI00332D9739